MVMADRQVFGDTVVIPQDLAIPVGNPPVLVLSDQMLDRFQKEDRYVKCVAMFGYTLRDYTRDIADELIHIGYRTLWCSWGPCRSGCLML